MRRRFLYFACFLCLIAAVSANVDLRLEDAGKQVTDSIAYLDIDGHDIVDYVGGDGTLSMNLEEGEYHVQLILDNPATDGNDYAASFTVIQKDYISSDIVLTRVGSVRGFAVDARDNALPDASISLSCPGPSVIDHPSRTDASGAFFIKAAPTGPCRLLVNHGDAQGRADLDISQGDLIDVKVKLLPISKRIDRSVILLAMLAALLALLLVLRVINGAFQKKEDSLRCRSGRKNR